MQFVPWSFSSSNFDRKGFFNQGYSAQIETIGEESITLRKPDPLYPFQVEFITSLTTYHSARLARKWGGIDRKLKILALLNQQWIVNLKRFQTL